MKTASFGSNPVPPLSGGTILLDVGGSTPAVLTAAHCLDGGEKFRDAHRITNPRSSVALQGATIHLHGRYRKGRVPRAHDAAVLLTAHPLALPHFSKTSATLALADELLLVYLSPDDRLTTARGVVVESSTQHVLARLDGVENPKGLSGAAAVVRQGDFAHLVGTVSHSGDLAQGSREVVLVPVQAMNDCLLGHESATGCLRSTCNQCIDQHLLEVNPCRAPLQRCKSDVPCAELLTCLSAATNEDERQNCRVPSGPAVSAAQRCLCSIGCPQECSGLCPAGEFSAKPPVSPP